MKKIIRECPIIIGIGAVAIILTLVAVVFKDTAYAEYNDNEDSGKTPALTAVLNGARVGVFPWTTTKAEDDVLLADNAGDGQDAVSEIDTSSETDVGATAKQKADEVKALDEKADADMTAAADGQMSADGKAVAGEDDKASVDSKTLAESDEKGNFAEEVIAAEMPAGQQNAKGEAGQVKAPGVVSDDAQKAEGDVSGDAQNSEADALKASGDAQKAEGNVSGDAQKAEADAREMTQETAQEIPTTASKPQAVPVVEDRVYNFTTVGDDYFSDALFIGDSRTVGLSEYCAPLDQRAVFYAKISMSIYDVMKKKFISSPNGKIGLEQALSENSFGKIYIMLGLNEIGTGSDEYFRNAYKGVVDRIRELQPGAIIYIQGIMHVTANKSNSNQYFNNQRINSRNAAISTLADQKYIFYIDMNPAVDDENGDLMQDLSFDDVHLKASSYQRWYDFLLQHAIVR